MIPSKQPRSLDYGAVFVFTSEHRFCQMYHSWLHVMQYVWSSRNEALI